MTDVQPDPVRLGPKFKKGDLVWVTDKFVANVIEIYPDNDAAAEANGVHLWATTIKRHAPWDQGSFHYLCEVANVGKKRIGGAEADLRLRHPGK